MENQTIEQICRATNLSPEMVKAHNITITFDSLIDDCETWKDAAGNAREYIKLLEAQIIRPINPVIARLAKEYPGGA